MAREGHHATESATRSPAVAGLPAQDDPSPDGRSAAGRSTGIAQAGRDKAKARDILAGIRTLQRIEQEGRQATPDERHVLGRFGGFGPVALSLFPDPVTGSYKDHGWQALGEELKALLSAKEYDSAKRTTYNAFYTSPTVITSMHAALARLGVPSDATVLEPGCGTGNFLELAPQAMRFIGVERDSLSGRIARARHPEADIRIEDYTDTRLREGQIDAVIGNVPFSREKQKYGKQWFSLHDYFFAKSIDALKPGGVLGLVTSHYTLDKQNAAVREHLAGRADFLGAIRLPSDAFAREGTSVVTDIVFLRKRAPGEPANHADPVWLETRPLSIDGAEIPINRYFLNHPEMVLGTYSRENRLYDSTYSVTGNGDLAEQLAVAVSRLPERAPAPAAAAKADPAPAFIPPPPLTHLTESSFFVGPDRVIYQMEGGQGVSVTYGGTLLKSDGTKTGRRMAGLIGMVTLARRVLQSQNEGWPEEHRNGARKNLNRAYDQFVRAYGPINKTTFSANADGTVIRRMPNLVKFREDPDAMLVMSLEDYDEVTGKAAKAAIMLKDVVGRAPAVTSVNSAEEGLLVSLNHRGSVDLPYIAELYGQPEVRIIEELGDLIYRDPESGAWQTADQYLSGNVRAKLAAAERAGPAFARNAEALRAVQPEDVLPGDIDANLGAPWIPEADIQAFAADLFRVAPTSIQVGHLAKDAEWTLDAGHSAEQSVAATAEFGTPLAKGTLLLELALNMKTPTIYDTIHTGERKERIVNQEATLAAREKQKAIKERFRAWIFADPDRAERLNRLYNDTYNNLRPRKFDGSHLDFPGMNRTITLDQHQKDAVWRGMSSGNTLLAHVVGGGKTFTMAATGMKMKQAGLINKPIFDVPNNMLEQFAREFQQLYPNARLLVAGKEDVTRDRRKFLTARIASGDWDGIVTTHSSFERMGMSRDYQEKFLREQIKEYEELLCGHARSDTSRGNRNLIKTIERQKAAREARLKDLLAGEKKDDGLVFDELGIDHLFIDEAHYFKNLETPTKMDRVAGIQTGGSERAFDLFMKARYLDERHPGHGLTFATGTPISNTLVEIYTLQRFLDPEGLRSRGIEHFDAWAATFGEVAETMEISPDGKTLKPRSRFSNLVNYSDLEQLYRSFADVQTAEMLDLARPKLEGGKPTVVACPMSDEQRELQADLVRRYDRIRSSKVDPREDNALAITTDGRKLALSAHLLSSTSLSTAISKTDLMNDMVVDRWQRSGGTRGAQLIFCDMGVNPTPWGFCVYDDIVNKLTSKGIPKQQIAIMGDADTDAKKQALFERVRQGIVRVLIGSTSKMGTGTNVQKRLVALHHLDAPWKPAEVEQREGRILRQGNENREVAIYRYVTEGSFDAYMWQALETKARSFAKILAGQSGLRRVEDIGGQELSYAEVKAIASGNPAVLTLAQADAELRRLTILKKNHDDEQFIGRRNLRGLPATIILLTQRVDDLTADMATMAAHADDPIMIGGHAIAPEDEVKALARHLNSIPEKVRQAERFPLGIYRGLKFGIVLNPSGAPEAFLEGAATRYGQLSRDSHGPRAILNALDRLADGYKAQAGTARKELAIAEGQRRDYQARLGAPFAHDAYQAELTGLRDQLRASLSGSAADGDKLPPAQEIAERIQALKSAHTIEPAPARIGTARKASAEEPVTARIRQRLGIHVTLPPAAEPEPPAPPPIPAPVLRRLDDAPPAPAQPKPSYQDLVTGGRLKKASQMSLF